MATLPTLQQASTQTYDPTKVSDVFGGLINQDNPLMKAAETQSKQGFNSKGLLNSSMAQQAGQNAMYGAAYNIANADATAANSANQFNAQQSNAQNQFNAQQYNDIAKTGMESDNKLQLAGIESNYKTLMQANQSASDMYQQTVKNIESIQTNKDIAAATKTDYINNQLLYMKNYFGMLEKMNNISGLKDLLTF